MAELRPAADDVATSSDAPTAKLPSLDTFRPADPADKPGLHARLFGSTEFFRLWLTQVVSATGDWLGFLAIAVLATRIGASSPEASVGLVLGARMLPGFFLAPLAGFFADRYDRKRLMASCDLGRACVLISLPFVDTIAGLVLASLFMEVLTLLWAPAKEASVPHLVPQRHLTTANSLSLVAAYGTMPLAAGIFSLMAKAAESVNDVDGLGFLRADKVGLAFYVDAATFVLSAIMILTLPLPRRTKAERTPFGLEDARKRIDFRAAFTDVMDGWKFTFGQPRVRAVTLGLATGLIGGGMLVPLGPEFASNTLNAGEAGFGFLIFSMGVGVALGILTLSVIQKRVPKDWTFSGAVLGASISLFFAAAMTSLRASATFVAMLGIFAGAVYVVGFTLLHENVDDEMRGRIFGSLYTLVRFCVLLAFAVGPLLAGVLDNLSSRLFGSDKRIGIFGVDLFVPGVRLALWLASLIILFAAAFAARNLRSARRLDESTSA